MSFGGGLKLAIIMESQLWTNHFYFNRFANSKYKGFKTLAFVYGKILFIQKSTSHMICLRKLIC